MSYLKSLSFSTECPIYLGTHLQACDGHSALWPTHFPLLLRNAVLEGSTLSGTFCSLHPVLHSLESRRAGQLSGVRCRLPRVDVTSLIGVTNISEEHIASILSVRPWLSAVSSAALYSVRIQNITHNFNPEGGGYTFYRDLCNHIQGLSINCSSTNL
jgi:hypothetical protein